MFNKYDYGGYAIDDQQGKGIVFAVIGAGNGGCAMAAHLSIMGFQVNLFNRSEENLRTLKIWWDST